MSSTPGNVKAILAGRRTTTKTKRRLGPTRGSCPKANNGGRKKLECSSKVVSAKLETLKNLIPNGKSCSADTVQADKLFQETADYILLLRTQVVVLKKLIEVYGSSSTEKEDNNVDAAVS